MALKSDFSKKKFRDVFSNLFNFDKMSELAVALYQFPGGAGGGFVKSDSLEKFGQICAAAP